MKNQKKGNRLTRFIRFLYLKLFRINDSPQRIAAGFGIGVFTGILPGTGPLASLFLAFLFKVNRAAAFLGSLLTNTWLSFVTFALSIKTGSAILRIDWQIIKEKWASLIRDFHWADLIQVSTLKILAPVALGYVVIGLCAGIIAYAIAYAIVKSKAKIGLKK